MRASARAHLVHAQGSIGAIGSPVLLRPGDVFGNYRVTARLRSGGMATLYLARRTGAAGFERLVALKVIHPHLAADRAFVRMFVDEAMLASKVQDPHVVLVEELGQVAESYFIAMEYVHGWSLSQVLRKMAQRRMRIAPEMAVRIVSDVASGLHAAHQAHDEDGQPLNIVHRDVSPENVLLSHRGHVKLIDFGIAKARSGQRNTASGSLRGKIGYMPPEQAYGRPVDRRADIYALGVVLWEMLTMQRLFTGDNDFAVLESVRNPHVRPPSQVVPDLPPELDAVTLEALAPDVENRPRTALEFRRALLEACPLAVQRESLDIASFLRVVMEDAPAHRLLPKEVTDALREQGGPVNDAILDREHVLRTMTIHADDVATDFDGPDTPVDLPAHASRGARTARTWLVGASIVGVTAVAATYVGLALFDDEPEIEIPVASPVDTEPAPRALSNTELGAVVTPADLPRAQVDAGADEAPALALEPHATKARAAAPRRRTTPAKPPEPREASEVKMVGGVPIKENF